MSLYRARCESPLPRLLLMAGIGLVIGLGAMVAFGLPRLQSTAPESGGARAGVSARSPVVITFTRPMNHESVESRLRIDPPVAGNFVWSGATVEFRPKGEWPPGTIRVSLDGGAESDRGLPLLFGRSWEFSVGAPRVAYLFKTNEAANIWTISLAGGDAAQLTKETVGVREFSVSPDGTQIVYTAERADGGGDLRRISRDGSTTADVLACPEALCASPVFSPDGQRVAYERLPLRSGDAAGVFTPGAPTVEVLEIATGKILRPSPNAGDLTRSPFFSPDGRLGYINTTLQATGIYDFAAQFTTYAPNGSGEIGTWSPDGKYLVYPEIIFPPEPTPAPGATAEPGRSNRFFSHLLRVTVATNDTKNLSGSADVEDASPVYSPSGEWLAFGRKALNEEQWTPGRQLWVMRADGSDARRLTAEPDWNHSAFVWSPDGSRLVYMRFHVTDPASPAEIWTIAADGSDARPLVVGGYLPEWLP